jgi:hypothetical protein
MMHRHHAYQIHSSHQAANRAISGPTDYSSFSPKSPSHRARVSATVHADRSGCSPISLHASRRRYERFRAAMLDVEQQSAVPCVEPSGDADAAYIDRQEAVEREFDPASGDDGRPEALGDEKGPESRHSRRKADDGSRLLVGLLPDGTRCSAD